MSFDAAEQRGFNRRTRRIDSDTRSVEPGASMSTTETKVRLMELFDRRADTGRKSAITDNVSLTDFPYELVMQSPPFAMGATLALIACDPVRGRARENAEYVFRAVNFHAEMLEALEDLVQAHDVKMGASAVQLRIDRAKDAIAKARGKE